MNFDALTLLQDLTDRTHRNIAKANHYQQLSVDKLTARTAPDSWNVLECLEHLNLYGDFYLPAIERSIMTATSPSTPIFKSGVLGNYFAKSMLPREKTNKMATFKDKNPIGSNLGKEVIVRFVDQQHKLLRMLDQCRTINITKAKTGTSIASWIKLRLGDTLRVVIYHNDRHIVQADHVLESLKYM